MVRVLILHIILLCYTVIIIVTVNGNCPGTVDGRSFNIILYCHYHSNSESSLNRGNLILYIIQYVTVKSLHFVFLCNCKTIVMFSFFNYKKTIALTQAFLWITITQSFLFRF